MGTENKEGSIFWFSKYITKKLESFSKDRAKVIKNVNKYRKNRTIIIVIEKMKCYNLTQQRTK